MDLRNFIPFIPPFERPPAAKRSAVVALGGGGARGLAHLGVMEVLAQTRVRPERFVGVSIGALVGALCALDSNVHHVRDKVLGFLSSPSFQHHQQHLFGSAGVTEDTATSGIMAWYDRAKNLYSAHRRLTRAVTQISLMPEAILTASIDELVPDVEFSDLPMPLSIVAADLRSGHRVVLETGSVRSAIHASMALPGIFPPVEHDGMLLCDIGVVDSIPTCVASSYATDLTIVVDIGQHNARMEKFETALDIMMRMQDIGEQILRREKTELADIHIRPELADVSWFDFQNPEEIIERGRSAAWEELSRHSIFRVDSPAEKAPADEEPETSPIENVRFR
ncbi:patatin-like phospholipase family protein [Aporhodopirellula aestuarii]|uniref:Patatin-like phospholipase family protein n=1 Tax=Aporhodopirellula aestuarii TaxID=2950107 RepID=A0ABT0UDR2_9BACT|nr:patatin-like phospholipase family protein [Aporhodopirellula aestuarii]MCM2374605.1 patatin-like phospholipase family protein [Aporhodopirellula aestuarii]